MARSTAPGLGYGLIWNSGPLAVVSTPVLASPFFINPVVHVPLQHRCHNIKQQQQNIFLLSIEPEATFMQCKEVGWYQYTFNVTVRREGTF